MHVVLIGHSFIRRLGEFMDDNRDRANLNLDPNRVTVHCFGLGGASFRAGSKCIVHYVNTVMSQLTFNPTVVFLHVGENDIMSASPNSLCDNLQSLIHQLSVVYRVPVTVVGQLLPFPVLNSPSWRSSLIAVNLALERAYRRNRKILYWKHRGGFWNPSRDLYLRDKVHLDKTGQLIYWRSVHRAVKTALETVTSFGC